MRTVLAAALAVTALTTAGSSWPMPASAHDRPAIVVEPPAVYSPYAYPRYYNPYRYEEHRRHEEWRREHEHRHYHDWDYR